MLFFLRVLKHYSKPVKVAFSLVRDFSLVTSSVVLKRFPFSLVSSFENRKNCRTLGLVSMGVGAIYIEFLLRNAVWALISEYRVILEFLF